MQGLKYNFQEYLSPKEKEKILQELSISPEEFGRKCRAEIGEPEGFDTCELRLLSCILNMPVVELFTKGAIEYFCREETGVDELALI